ncbi:MAG: glycosyltransferase family 2 protein [Burkholderiales bacterium]|nr:glycosyltransferase family 2 protein [Burkholderiales bacterium]
MVIMLLTLGGVFMLLALHPFTTYPLSLMLIRKFRKGTDAARVPENGPAAARRMAVCMCAYNEEQVIRQKMDNLLALRNGSPDLGILVYVDGSTDRTADILRAYSGRIRLFVSPDRRGKTHGMNLLVSHAEAPIVVFTDANVMLDPRALLNLQRHFDDPQTGCVCGHLVYTNPGESVTAASGSLYWRMEEAIKKLEEETGSVMGADGSLFAIRRELHRPPPEHLIDDMFVSMTILADGYRIVQATDVVAYEASASSQGEEFRRKARIACQAFNVHRILWPRIRKLGGLNVYKYVSHKLLRWFTIYSLSLSSIFLLAAMLVAGRPALAAALVIAATAALVAGHRHGVRPFSQAADVLIALAGAGLGVWQSFRGRRYQTWAPATSVRKA